VALVTTNKWLGVYHWIICKIISDITLQFNKLDMIIYFCCVLWYVQCLWMCFCADYHSIYLEV